ncbi:uncharacterized protein PAC_17059 [Phialocephala subalpina]|uniref:Uncharacterized protein n=1 Tax=Phialocephala subalpina TaxID=576137 RepID=A0A1L7XQ47_9HELO|nr:uncharacterized protein PAC_17059 [Phialocephala subalpina]
MAQTMIFVLAMLAIISMVEVFAAPSQDLSPVIPETHTHGDMEFKGTIHGVDFQANGTVESIYAQFTKQHPNVVASFNADHLPVGTGQSNGNNSALVARNKILPPNCAACGAWGWVAAETDTINDGVNYLIHHAGTCGVGPRSCVRISCSYSAAIYLCNDNYYGIAPSCVYLASYAKDLTNDCSFWDAGANWTCGQEFDTDAYNVIVHYDDHNC